MRQLIITIAGLCLTGCTTIVHEHHASAPPAACASKGTSCAVAPAPAAGMPAPVVVVPVPVYVGVPVVVPNAPVVPASYYGY